MLPPPSPNAPPNRFDDPAQGVFWSDGHPPEPPRRTRPDDDHPGFFVRPLVVGAAVVTAVSIDLAVRHPAASLATTAMFVAFAIGLLVTGVLESRPSRAAAAGVPVFALFLMLRTSAWLVPLNLLASGGLLLIAVSTARSGGRGYGFRNLLAMPFVFISDLFHGFDLVLHLPRLASHRPRLRHVVRVATGLGLAVPLVVVVASLLAVGDAAFANLLGRAVNGQAIEHIILISLGSLFAALTFRSALFDDMAAETGHRRVLGTIEAVTIVGALGAVLALFGLAQVVDTIAGVDSILQSRSDTRAWVHDGFFPLLWASAITLGSLLLLDHLVRLHTERHERWFFRSTAGAASLTLVVVAVAMYRIWQYSERFGFTMLRLYSLAFASWIGVVFILFAVRSLRPAASRSWFCGAVAATALTLVAGLNIANPEARIVRFDAQQPARFDVDYLTSELSDDAIPALVDVLDDLAPDTADRVATTLCASPRTDGRGGAGWNRSRAAAHAALDDLCG